MKDKTLDQNLQAYRALAKQYVAQNTDRSQIISELTKIASSLPQGSRLLDLGCGVGFDSREFRRLRPDLEILGIDASEEMLTQFAKIAPGVEYQQADMRNLDLDPNSFGGIWMNASLLHIPKKDAIPLLRNLNTILQQNGYLYISVKEGKGEKLVKAAKYGINVERFFAFYTKTELQKLVEATGFTILDIQKNRIGDTVWIWLIAQKS